MQAIILTAGLGSRLKKFINYPKSLIKINDTQSIIERIVLQLKSQGINEIYVVTGFKHELIKKELGKKVKYIYFKNIYKTNNLQTLLSVKNILNKPSVCLFADIIFDIKILKKILLKKEDIVLAIKKGKILKDTMRVKIKRKKIVDMGNQVKVENADGNFLGLAKFTKFGIKFLKKYLEKNKYNNKDYYTKAIVDMIKDNFTINYLDINKLFWKEIDTKKDLNSLNILGK